MQRAPEREFQKRNVYISRFGWFFFDPGLCAMKGDYKSWKKLRSLRCQRSPELGGRSLILQEPHVQLGGKEPYWCCGALLKGCSHGAGFPQAQLRPRLPSLILEHLKSVHSEIVLLGYLEKKTGNSGQKGGLTFTGSFSGCPPLTDISPFSMSIARKQKARSFSHPEICVLLLYPEKG